MSYHVFEGTELKASSPHDGMLGRVEDLVAAVAIMSAEMNTLQRYACAMHASVLLLCVSFTAVASPGVVCSQVGGAVSKRRDNATQCRQYTAIEFLMSAAEERIQGNFATDEEHAKLYTQLLQLASNVDMETNRIWEACNSRKRTRGAPGAGDSTPAERSIDRFLSAQATSPTFAPSGSAAVTFARSEHCRANTLADEVRRLESERDQLLAEQKTAQSRGMPVTTS